MRDIKRLKEELELVHEDIERIEKLREDLKQTSEKLDQEIEKLNKSAQECYADAEIDRSDTGEYYEYEAGRRREDKEAIDKSLEKFNKELEKLKYRERNCAKAIREAEKQMERANPGRKKGILQQAAEAISDAFSVLIDAGKSFVRSFQKGGSKGNDFSGVSPEDIENLEKQIREALLRAGILKEQAKNKEETIKSKETIEYIIGQQNLREEQKVLNIAALCAQTGEKVYAGIGHGKILSFSCREENGATLVDITEIDVNGKEKEAKVAEIPVRQGILGRSISREDISVLDFDQIKKAVTGRELVGLSPQDREKLTGKERKEKEKTKPEEKSAEPETQQKEPEKKEKAAAPETKKEKPEPAKGSFEAALKEELKKDAARFAEKAPEKRAGMPSADFEKLYPKAETLRLARDFRKAAAEAKKNPGKEIAVGKDYTVSYSVMEGKPDRLFVARTDNKNFRKSVRLTNRRGEDLPFVKKNGSMGYNTVFGQILSTGIIKDTAPMREINEKYSGHTQFTAEETAEILGAAARQSSIDKERGTKDMNIIMTSLNVKSVSEPVLQDAVSALVGSTKDSKKKQEEIAAIVQTLKEDPQLSGIAAGFEANALYRNMKAESPAKADPEKPQSEVNPTVQVLEKWAEDPEKRKELLAAVIYSAELDRKNGTHNTVEFLLKNRPKFEEADCKSVINYAKDEKHGENVIKGFISDGKEYYKNFPGYDEICWEVCKAAIDNYGEQYNRYVGLGCNIENVNLENLYFIANSPYIYDKDYRPVNANGRPAAIEDAKTMNPALYQDMLDSGKFNLEPQTEQIEEER